MNMRKKNHRKISQPRAHCEEGRAVLYQMLKAVTAGLFLLAALLLLFSFAMTKADIPFSLLEPISLVMISASCILAGYLAARRIRKNGLPVGAGCGVIIWLVLIMLSMFFFDGFDLQLIFKLAISVLSGSIGGVLGVNQKARRKI